MENFNNANFICSTAKDFLEKSSLGARDAYLNAQKLDSENEGQLESLGKLAFPMVTAAFSLELALKGLLMHHHIKIPLQHNLEVLFYLLPDLVQENIIEHYLGHDEFGGYPNMHIKLGDKNNPIPPSTIAKKETIEGHVKELIEKHKNSFVDFRYLHEFGIKKSELAMDYNYFSNFSYSAICTLANEIGLPIS